MTSKAAGRVGKYERPTTIPVGKLVILIAMRYKILKFDFKFIVSKIYRKKLVIKFIRMLFAYLNLLIQHYILIPDLVLIYCGLSIIQNDLLKKCL